MPSGTAAGDADDPRSGTVKKAGKHGVVVEVEGNSHKLFWDEVESVKKAGKHGETTAKPAAANANFQKYGTQPVQKHGTPHRARSPSALPSRDELGWTQAGGAGRGTVVGRDWGKGNSFLRRWQASVMNGRA